MDDQGNVYVIYAPEQVFRRDLRQALALQAADLGRLVTESQAAEKALTPITRPLTRAERKSMKIGRNSPCGCGSGLKFKRCCLGKSPSSGPEQP